MAKQAAKTFDRVTELALTTLNGKWKAEILWHLHRQPRRYSQLRAAIPGLSDKMLTQRLHELMESGLVRHGRAPGAATGHYTLTSTGRLLDGLLRDIYSWGQQHSRFFRARLGAVSRPIAARRRTR